MLVLDATTKSLEIILGGAITTNQLPVVVSYGDITSTTFTLGEADSISNNTSTVTILAAPGASTQRQVKYIGIYNADTVAATVTLRLNNNSTLRTIIKATLSVGDTLHYIDSEGFMVTDSTGNAKIGGVNALLGFNNIWTGTNTFSVAPVVTPFNAAGFVKNDASGVLSSSPLIINKQIYLSDLTSTTTFPLDTYAAFAYTINSVKQIKTSSGTVTLAFKIGSTNITGLSAVAVTATPQDVNATAANAVAIGDAVTMVASSNVNPLNLQFSLLATRTA